VEAIPQLRNELVASYWRHNRLLPRVDPIISPPPRVEGFADLFIFIML
jgi:hypothetical protein